MNLIEKKFKQIGLDVKLNIEVENRELTSEIENVHIESSKINYTKKEEPKKEIKLKSIDDLLDLLSKQPPLHTAKKQISENTVIQAEEIAKQCVVKKENQS